MPYQTPYQAAGWPPHPTRATVNPPPPPPHDLRASAIPHGAMPSVLPASVPSRGISEAGVAAIGLSPLWKKDHHAKPHHHPAPGEPCDSCAPSYPAQGLDPQPGTPLFNGTCADGACSNGACETGCNPCPVPCDACPQHGCPPPPLEHRYPCKPPRGYCGYGNLEVLYWFLKRTESPALFIFGSNAETLSTHDVDHGERVGVRAFGGLWLSHELCLGIEAGGFYLFEHRADRALGALPLVRPFQDATGADAFFPINDGVTSTGQALVGLRTRFHGGEVNLRWQILRGCCGHLDLLGGFRYLSLEDDLTIQTDSIAVATGDHTFVSDEFRTRNQFFGGQVGANGELSWGCLFVNAYGKVGLGNNRQQVSIRGKTIVDSALTGTVATETGFLARSSNIGDYQRDELCLVPEAGISVGLKITSCLRIYGGYSILMMLDAVRPGEQIDTFINPTPGVAPARPAPNFQEDRFWVQGGHAGIEFRY